MLDDFGNLLFIGFQQSLNTEIIKKYNPTGVILYPKNMEDVYLLQIIMEKLYTLMDHGYRFLISSDHEGGQLETIPNIFPSPGNLAIGKVGRAYSYGEYLGKMLKMHGFNMVFAPVVDVKHPNSSHVTGFRAYSSDHKIVEKSAKEFILGLKKHKIAATLKHFPGHGKAIEDSHFTLPVVKDFVENDNDILIFKNLSKEVDFIMTAHILYPKIDNVIATLSKKFLTNILKEKYKYNGLIISDALEMKALYDNYSPKEIIKKFFESGGDILLIGDIEKHFEIVNTFYSMIKNKELDVDFLKEKISKIKKIKEKYIEPTYYARFLSDIAKKAIEYNLKSPTKNPDFLIPTPKNLSLADTSEKDLKHLKLLIKTEFPKSKIFEKKYEFEDTVVYFVLDKVKKIRAKRVVYVFLRKFFNTTNEYILPYSSKLISIYHVLQLLKGEGLT
ncbi:glycoside hydrolase family 3 [Thermosipho melanesiensis]|uniref:beta-N-acetylhexosaminidase n=2 Tax=Thermosipho melanesiensis TaxID=46541 RepID=A6LKV2_THEM4|nr:glycoside hydrolase family 3 N-terminal domain-containing protein [Thermosipho melanesiensis]ABR30553.1 glycoside hydrolase, family 3 domain protein [Thermosipho melanesiensis BI429]APT73701.1 glycoside hydrolase family 3 [Thermosipho melanesiensis]OOC35640.1 glycoside hydrolase family 3 [Thermosipho melanesiensis]OOC39315.1 glycoside hydrolase family 3 [Thermosipho melanesiensis]OOC39401.1 glycoside hydrolase family 3 [Thermosipho melanesiensis]